MFDLPTAVGCRRDSPRSFRSLDRHKLLVKSSKHLRSPFVASVQYEDVNWKEDGLGDLTAGRKISIFSDSRWIGANCFPRAVHTELPSAAAER